MSYICIIIVLLASFFCYRNDKTLFSPTVSFTLLFAVVFFLSVSGWYGLFLAGDEAYIYITLGIISFVFGALARKKYSLKNAFYNTGKKIHSIDVLKEKTYNIMLIITLIILSFSATMILSFILSGKTIGDVYIVAAAATDGADDELTKGSFQILLESYIAYPLLYLLVPVSLVEFFNTYKKRYLIIAIFLTLLRVCLDARRTYLTAFIMMIVICIYMHRKDFHFYTPEMLKKYKKFKKYALLIILLFGYFFVFVSQQRSIARNGEDLSNTLSTLTYYYGGCVQFFWDSVKNIPTEYTLGFSALRGFFAPFFGIFRLIGIATPDLLENANTYLESLHAHILLISPDKYYNSFATCFFQFYCDGGILGIIVLSFFYGYYSQNIFERMVIKRSKEAETAYVFFFANILMLSFVNMETVLALNFWPLILVKMLYTKNEVQDNGRG